MTMLVNVREVKQSQAVEERLYQEIYNVWWERVEQLSDRMPYSQARKQASHEIFVDFNVWIK